MVPIADDQIRDFHKKPKLLEQFVSETIRLGKGPRCDLFDWWAVVHYAITGGAADAALPLGAIRKGDVYYDREPAHAIYSATVKALAERLEGVTDATVKATLDARDVKSVVYPGRYWAAQSLADDGELRGVLQGFRAFVAKAAAENRGLLFCRYEDW